MSPGACRLIIENDDQWPITSATENHIYDFVSLARPGSFSTVNSRFVRMNDLPFQELRTEQIVDVNQMSIRRLIHMKVRKANESPVARQTNDNRQGSSKLTVNRSRGKSNKIPFNMTNGLTTTLKILIV